MTWPCNPVGSGSRGHKPPPNKRPRRSATPPTPLSPTNPPPYAPIPQPSAAPASTGPEARHPTGEGSPAPQAAPTAAQPAVHAAHAHMPPKLDQPPQLPSGSVQHLPGPATDAHTASMPQPQLQSMSVAQPQPQTSQLLVSPQGNSRPVAGVSSDRQSGLADHPVSVAVPVSTAMLHQPVAVSLLPNQTASSAQPPALLQHTAQPDAQPWAQPEAKPGAQPGAQPGVQPEAQPATAEVRQSAEPNAMAASTGLTLPTPPQPSNNFGDSRSATVLGAQGVAAAAGAQPMALDAAVAGKKYTHLSTQLHVYTICSLSHVQ